MHGQYLPPFPFVFDGPFLLYGVIECVDYDYEVRLIKYPLDLVWETDQCVATPV